MFDKKYAIYSDVDGTIYSHKQEWGSKTEKQIKDVEKHGFEFILCTGNPYFENMINLADKLDVNYFIGSSGAVVMDVKNKYPLFINGISDKHAEFIFKLAKTEGVSLHWWDSTDMYANEFLKPILRDIFKSIVSDSRTFEIVDYVTKNIHKMEINVDNDEKAIKKLDKIELILKKIGLQVARVAPYHIEITNPDASKGNAIRQLNNHLGIAEDDFMTIGDSANDHSMLVLNEHSYAMGNSSDLTKEIANNVVGDVLENGLGEAMKDFISKKNKNKA